MTDVGGVGASGTHFLMSEFEGNFFCVRDVLYESRPERRQILHSTGYVLRPDGTIAVAVYSTGPVGRLVWQDVLSLVQGYKQRGQR